MNIIQLVIGSLLFFVLFFGIAFLLNMLLRKTWVMAIFYPIVIAFIVDKFPVSQYFTNPGQAFSTLWNNLLSLHAGDIVILAFGFAGTIVSGFVIRLLRAKGYQMF
ncbi:MAG: YuiB family protein [Bacillaceae bacterium]|nr:YuiB family protein [Bacillaceae bacterium]